MKTLKPNTTEEDRVKFLQEAAIMGQFNHPNVVKLYGVVTVGEPVSDLQSAWIGCNMLKTCSWAALKEMFFFYFIF